MFSQEVIKIYCNHWNIFTTATGYLPIWYNHMAALSSGMCGSLCSTIIVENIFIIIYFILSSHYNIYYGLPVSMVHIIFINCIYNIMFYFNKIWMHCCHLLLNVSTVCIIMCDVCSFMCMSLISSRDMNFTILCILHGYRTKVPPVSPSQINKQQRQKPPPRQKPQLSSNYIPYFTQI